MARKRYTAEQIIGTRREAEVALAQGDNVGKVARRLGVTEPTSYRGRREDGGLQVDQAKRLKERERENVRRKKLVADQALDNAIRKEAASGNFCARRAGARQSRTRGPRWSSRSVGPVGSSPSRAAGSGTPPGWRRTSRPGSPGSSPWPAASAVLAPGASRPCCGPRAGG